MRMKKVESAAALKKMKMPILTPVIGWLLLLLLFCLSHLRVEGQRGFISIDCGLPQASNNTNGVFVYVSDSGFIDSGINKEVNLSLPNIPAIYQTLRSFPIYKRNCYSLPVIQGQKYLVRALFMYGNYDGIGKSPSFDLYLGVDFWDSIKLDNATHIFRTEITAEAPTSSMSLCLVKSGGDVPFISAIELRMVVDGIYTPANRSLSLVTYRRINVGETREMRYPDDPYDRIWTPNYDSYGTPFSTNRTVREERKMRFGLSSAVMRTSVSSSKQIQISWPGGSDASFYIFMDFAELIQLKTTRELMITENGNNFIDSFNPDYLNSMVVYSKGPMNAATYTFLIKETNKSNYGVILNAYEVYKVTQVTGNVTYQSDVDALTSIKEYYKVNRNWIGDPCLPQDFTWDGLTCNYKNFSSPRVDTLDLSNSSLSGTVSKFLDQLTALRTLNLSKNNLQGSIPSFLAQIQNLTNLDLSSNNLSGPIPTLLQEKVNNGALILSTEDNPYICRQEPCNPSRTNNNKKGMIIGIAVGSAVVVATIIFLLIIKERRKNQPGGCFSTQGPRQSEKGSTFSYEEVVEITNNFQKVLGKGGSGTVYYGRLNDSQEVAVKIFKGTTSQETKEFSAEIKLLMKVHHKYLAQFVGFCDEDKHMILIYEYLPNGNLQQLISGQKVNWKQRLQIALNAATGLEYLHSGCRPPIIHRDVKSSNILLNENMEAKIADFGLSKICATEDITHISTAIAGTPGYIDPEYYNTNKLTEKSDVYSFGVVLFELISGRHAIIALADQRFHVVQWAVPKIVRGDIVSIVDPKLEGHCINSIWKVAEIAMACASDRAISRPTMTEVVNGLKEALEFETRQSRSVSLNIEAASSSSSSSNPVQSEIYLALNPSER